MKSGTDHRFYCTGANGSCQTTVIKFGCQLIDSAKIPSKTYLPPNTKFTIKLDMRDVMDAFKKDGYFRTFDGNKIYKEDFKAVYVVGNTAPINLGF